MEATREKWEIALEESGIKLGMGGNTLVEGLGEETDKFCKVNDWDYGHNEHERSNDDATSCSSDLFLGKKNKRISMNNTIKWINGMNEQREPLKQEEIL